MKKRRLVNIVVLIVFIFIILTVVFPRYGGYVVVHEINETSETYEALPRMILDFKLIQKQTGREAVAEIKRLHPKEFEIENAFTGVYSNGSKIYIWVSVSGSEERAQELLDLMNRDIVNSEIFSNPRAEMIMGYMVYRVDGMDMDHYYYRYNEMVIWIATDDENSMEIVRDYMSYLKPKWQQEIL